eukprot:38460-Eustigmatos_ZCMA.PRE.1
MQQYIVLLCSRIAPHCAASKLAFQSLGTPYAPALVLNNPHSLPIMCTMCSLCPSSCRAQVQRTKFLSRPCTCKLTYVYLCVQHPPLVLFKP